MNVAAAKVGYVIAFESSHNGYVRYEDIETPGVGLRAFSVPQLNVVVQYSEKAGEATIIGPKWAVEELFAADGGLSEQDAHADS